jgi:glucosyl-3-phosphoglycerate synthase
MADFVQHGLITTLHDLGAIERERLEQLLRRATRDFPIGLILPVTAEDMRAKPFATIIDELKQVDYLTKIVVVLGIAPTEADYWEARSIVDQLGDRASILWIDSPRMRALYDTLNEAGLHVSASGKGQAVWTAFGYLLGDTRLKAFILHDCDIVTYDRGMVARLCLPMAHPNLLFEFCKAYYVRRTTRMHGRVVRLLLAPLLQALFSMRGHDRFLVYLNSFRYPLAGEFAVSSTLARAIRVPSDWALEIGTLAEVFRNTSIKRVCQVDLCPQYEHKHQVLSLEDPSRGLMKMVTDILTTVFRTLASMGMVFDTGDFVTLQSAYLRSAQDAIRQYHADALMNGLTFDRHEEEQAVEGFAQQIMVAGDAFQQDPSGGEGLPNWSRVLSAFPEFPQQLQEAAQADAAQSVPERGTAN